MSVEMAIWRMTETGLQQLSSTPLDLERRLEDMLTEDPWWRVRHVPSLRQ